MPRANDDLPVKWSADVDHITREVRKVIAAVRGLIPLAATITDEENDEIARRLLPEIDELSKEMNGLNFLIDTGRVRDAEGE